MDNFVSIIVPCYNQAQFLSDALKSVLSQTYSSWECIIVNDGSTDNTEEVAKAFCLKDSRFKYIIKENSGLPAARNTAIKNSAGEYILPLDSDDIIGEVYLDKAIKHFVDFPETKLVYCKAEFFGDVIKQWELEEYNYENLLFRNMIFCSALFKRIDFNKTIGYNENMIYGLEDWDFWLTLLNEKDIVYRIPETLFYYRIKPNSMSRKLSIEKLWLMERQIVINHWGKYEKFLPGIIELSKNNHLETVSYLNNELKKIQASKSYRLGKLLIRPFSKIRVFFNK